MNIIGQKLINLTPSGRSVHNTFATFDFIFFFCRFRKIIISTIKGINFQEKKEHINFKFSEKRHDRIR